MKGLLFAGAKRDVVLNHGVTALHHACDTRSYEVAMLLLSYVDTARGKPPKVSMAPFRSTLAAQWLTLWLTL